MGKYNAQVFGGVKFFQARQKWGLARRRMLGDRTAMKPSVVVILFVLAAVVSPLRAQTSPAPSAAPSIGIPVDPEKRKMINEMMEMTQTAHFAEDMMNQTLASMKASTPNVPAEFWTEFQKKLDSSELQEHMVAAYDRYFTKDDLKAALAFYHTDIGQKMLSEMPALTRDVMAAGQEWGQKTGEMAARELDKRGLLKKGPGAATSPTTSPAASRSATPKASPKP
jgi:hypothetical protein